MENFWKQTEHALGGFVEGFNVNKIMKVTRMTVKWEKGLHMRAAAKLVQLARKFQSRIVVRLGSQVADARSIMGIMILAASLGTRLDIEASGDDEHEAIQAVEDYFDSSLPND